MGREINKWRGSIVAAGLRGMRTVPPLIGLLAVADVCVGDVGSPTGAIPGCERIMHESASCIGLAAETEPRLVLIGLESGSVCYSRYSLPADLRSASPSLVWQTESVDTCVSDHGPDRVPPEQYSAIARYATATVRLQDGGVEYEPEYCSAMTNDGDHVFILTGNDYLHGVPGVLIEYSEISRKRRKKVREILIGTSSEMLAVRGSSLFTLGQTRGFRTVYDDFRRVPTKREIALLSRGSRDEPDANPDGLEAGMSVLSDGTIVVVTREGNLQLFANPEKGTESAPVGIVRSEVRRLSGIHCRGSIRYEMPAGGGGRRADIPPLEKIMFRLDDLAGAWRTECQSGNSSQSRRGEMVFAGDRVIVTQSLFHGAGCKQLAKEERLTYRVAMTVPRSARFGPASPLRARFAATLEKAILTIHTREALVTEPFSLRNLAEVGVPVDVTGFISSDGGCKVTTYPAKGESREFLLEFPIEASKSVREFRFDRSELLGLPLLPYHQSDTFRR